MALSASYWEFPCSVTSLGGSFLKATRLEGLLEADLLLLKSFSVPWGTITLPIMLVIPLSLDGCIP